MRHISRTFKASNLNRGHQELVVKGRLCRKHELRSNVRYFVLFQYTRAETPFLNAVKLDYGSNGGSVNTSVGV